MRNLTQVLSINAKECERDQKFQSYVLLLLFLGVSLIRNQVKEILLVS